MIDRRSPVVAFVALGAWLALAWGVVAPTPAAAQETTCVHCAGTGRAGCLTCYSQRAGVCSRCRGSGTNPGDASKSCTSCFGSGRCDGCNGQGAPCVACNGRGKQAGAGGQGAQPGQARPAAPDPAEVARFVQPFTALRGACTIEGREGERTYTGEMQADVVAGGTWFAYSYRTRYSDGAEDSGAATVTYDPGRGRYVLNAFLSPGRAVSFQGAPQEDGSVVFDLGEGMRMIWTLEQGVLRSRVLRGEQLVGDERVTPKRP